MKQDSLSQFVKLRSSLTEEREYLRQRLTELDSVLNGEAFAAMPVTPTPTPAPVRRKYRKRVASLTMPENAEPLRSYVEKVLAKGPLPKEEILKRVQAKGYTFAAKEPMHSLLPLLYKACDNLGNGRFAARA